MERHDVVLASDDDALVEEFVHHLGAVARLGGLRLGDDRRVGTHVGGDDHGIGQHRMDPVADASGQLVDLGWLRWFGEGHDQGVAVDLQGHGPELGGDLDRHRGGGVRLRGEVREVDRRQLGQLGQRPHHDAREGAATAHEQVAERLVRRHGLVDHRLQARERLVAGLDQRFGQTGVPLGVRTRRDGCHATTRSTSSSVVSPSMALRSPA